MTGMLAKYRGVAIDGSDMFAIVTADAVTSNAAVQEIGRPTDTGVGMT